MPKIVDREKMREEILAAFEKCIEDKPISSISLRDIAKVAHVTHPTLLNYFSTKEDIITAYCERTKLDMVSLFEKWFQEHDPNDYDSALAYLDAFTYYVAEGSQSEERSYGRIQNIVMARYNQNIWKSITEEAVNLRSMLDRCLKKYYGDRIETANVEALSIFITGIYACRYCKTLTGTINKNMVSQFLKLVQL